MDALKLLQSRNARTIYEDIKGGEIASNSAGPTSYFITNCTDSQFDLSRSRTTQLTIERCKDCLVKIGPLIGSIQCISCDKIMIEFVVETTVALIVDSCTNSEFIFKNIEQLQNAMIITTNCKMIELSAGDVADIVPDSVTNSTEYKVQLRTTFKDNEFKSLPCNNYGDPITIIK